MFDIGTKISRAWNTIWQYKVLWIFGLLLAFTGGSVLGNGGGGGGGGSNYNFNKDQMGHMGGREWSASAPAWAQQFEQWFEQDLSPLFMPDRLVTTIIWMVVIIFAVSLVIGLLLALVRYPAETSVIRLVDVYETDGTKKKFKEGWRMGWNVRAFRIWVIDLIVGTPAFVIVAGLSAAVAVMVVRMTKTGELGQIPGMVGLIVLAGFLLLVLAIAMIFVGLWRQFIVRAIAIEGAGIGEGFKRGWEMLAHNFKNAFLTWLVMLGMNIAAGIALVIVTLVLIPVFAVMLIPGALVSAIPGAIAYGISSLFAAGPLVWLITGFVVMTFLFTVAFSPLSLVTGIYTVFSSSIWTQTYREMKSSGSQPPVLAVPGAVQPPPLG